MNRLKKIYSYMVSPNVEIVVGWIMVITSIIGWPVSALTFASNEPATVLGISWGALIFAGYSVVVAGHADKHAKEN